MVETDPAVGLMVTCRDTGEQHELTAYHEARAKRLHERGQLEMDTREETQAGSAGYSTLPANPRDVHMLVQGHVPFAVAFPSIRLLCTPAFKEKS